MGAVTYPDSRVKSLIERAFVPVRLDVEADAAARREFGSARTPTLLVVDADGREVRRHSGFLDPDQLLAELSLARLAEALERKDYEAAGRRLEDARRWAEADPERRAEALYHTAVAAYRSTGDPSELSRGWSRLLDEFPGSEWAERVAFLRG